MGEKSRYCFSTGGCTRFECINQRKSVICDRCIRFSEFKPKDEKIEKKDSL